MKPLIRTKYLYEVRLIDSGAVLGTFETKSLAYAFLGAMLVRTNDQYEVVEVKITQRRYYENKLISR